MYSVTRLKGFRKMYTQIKSLNIKDVKHNQIKSPKKLYNQFKRFQKDVLIIKLKYSKICTLYSIMIKFKDPRKMYNQI